MRTRELLLAGKQPLAPDGQIKPTLALLYEDTKELKHLKTYEVNLRDKSFIAHCFLSYSRPG